MFINDKNVLSFKNEGVDNNETRLTLETRDSDFSENQLKLILKTLRASLFSLAVAC